MRDGWFKMFGPADEAFIRFLARYLKDRLTGRFRVRFTDDPTSFSQQAGASSEPRPEVRGAVELLTPAGRSVASVRAIRYRHFRQVVDIMGYRPLTADGREYSSEQ